MSPIEIAHFLEELIRSETKVIAFSVVAVIVTLFGVYIFRKWILPAGDSEKLKAEIATKEIEIGRKELKINELEHRVDDRDRKIGELKDQAEATSKRHRNEKAAMQDRIKQISKECEDLKDAGVDLADKITEANKTIAISKDEHTLYQRKAVTVIVSYKKKVASLDKQIASLTGQIRQVEQQEGRFWENPVRTTLPPFRVPNGKTTSIIAVTNLKGGVGKTTLTANLAATIWKSGKRVLVVDLDHQTSLTSLCLTTEQLGDLRPGAGKFVNNVLRALGNYPGTAWDNLTRINADEAFILPASKELAEVEEHVKAKWLLNPSGNDARYLLRAALHDQIIQSRFDYVLLDCPPRPSTCLINALTCCDHVLIPARPDKTSTETVPYLLDWLRKLRELKICPNLEILGVVANQAYPRKKLISRERAAWEDLTHKCQTAWGSCVHHFDVFVPNSTQFAEAAATNTFAAFHPNLEPIFSDLFAEIQNRKVSHESSLAATSS